MIMRQQLPKLLISLTAILWCHHTLAKTCIGGAKAYIEADAVFSAIPMKGEISIYEEIAYFEVDVFRVWKGGVQPQETIAVALPRMLTLGYEYVLATSRDTNGRFTVTDCTPVKDAYKENGWISENLGPTQSRYNPPLLQSR